MKTPGILTFAAVALMLSAVLSCGQADRTPAPVRTDVIRITDFTGRGNVAEELLSLRIRPEYECKVNAVTVRLNCGQSSISRLSLSLDGETLCSSAVSAGTDSVVFRCKRKIPGTTVFQLTADIRPDAEEGALVSVDVPRIDIDGRYVMPLPPLPGGREILLCRKKLYGPGQYGSLGWRIPAILQLSDGTLLAVNDRRNDSDEDLPGCIDVVFSYSTDGGMSWSSPGYIARNGGYLHGFGDPGLAELPDGTVVCAFTGGEDFTHSNIDDPQHSYVSFSHDHGRSWTEPRDIASLIWGPDAVNPDLREVRSSFFSSGNYLVLKRGEHKGRLLIANVCMYKADSWLSNHVVYTDDGGNTWKVSEIAVRGQGDEAKMVELRDGSILMSVRANGDRIWVKSYDAGQTWTERGVWPDIHVTACNGDMISYNDSILLHSVPLSMRREDVGILLSFDEGRTWPEKKIISPGPGQYSSLTVLPDGTIGAYIEKNLAGGELWYENFSLQWLRSHPVGTTSQTAKGVRLWEGGPEWADCNLGASSPSDPGEFYAWGETHGKQQFGWDRYEGTSDDAASAVLGEGWSMPSEQDFLDLKSRCRWTWVEKDGYPGYEISGDGGASIFLPAGGYVTGSRHRNAGGVGQYWTSTTQTETSAREFWFNQIVTGSAFNRGRDNGLLIRAVRH